MEQSPQQFQQVQQHKKKNRGCLIVIIIAIVAVLSLIGATTILMFILSGRGIERQRMEARDTRREADLMQIQLGLEIYFDANDHYPNSTNNGSVNNLSDELTGGNILLRIPQDPSNGESFYNYYTNTNADHYILVATLEGRPWSLDKREEFPDELDDCSLVGNPAGCDCADVNKKYCLGK